MLILVDNQVLNTDQILRITLPAGEEANLLVDFAGLQSWFAGDSDAGRALAWWFAEAEWSTVIDGGPGRPLDVVRAWRDAGGGA